MSDDSVETPIDQTMITGALRRPPSLVPWVIVGITAGLLAALTVVLIRQVSAERRRANEMTQAHAAETARADKAELALIQAKARLAPLEEQVKELTAERDELKGRIRTLMLEAAKSSGATKAPEPAKPPAKKIAKKKPVKKKKKKR